jgi:hypothetical protein
MKRDSKPYSLSSLLIYIMHPFLSLNLFKKIETNFLKHKYNKKNNTYKFNTNLLNAPKSKKIYILIQEKQTK